MQLVLQAEQVFQQEPLTKSTMERSTIHSGIRGGITA